MTERRENKQDKKICRISRRELVEAVTSLGIVGTVLSFLSLLTSLVSSALGVGQQSDFDNIFRYGMEKGTWYSDRAGSEVKAEDFDQIGKGAGVLWRGTIPAIVIRVDESKLKGTTAVNGLIAFASACTHLCCISTWHLDRPNDDVLFCRCHDGIFDPYDVVTDFSAEGKQYQGARVLAGPPPKAAPMIPIEIRDGKVLGIENDLDIYGYCG